MAEYYNERSLLQGSTVPQFDVGTLTKAGSLVANALSGVREKEIENARLAREAERYKREGERYDREQLLNQRADVEYGKQQAVQQASRDIAKELIDTPYASKFGGTENTALIDEAVLKETERRNQLGLAPFNAEEAAGIQKTYEANRPFKEDARNKIAATLMSKGASAAQANQEAEGLTTGMISRADRQAMANQMRDDQQKYYDKVADNKLELYKTLTSNDLERMKALGNSYGISGGSGAKGGIGLSTSWDEVMSKNYNLSPYGTGWAGDDAKVRDLAVAARKDNVSPWAFQKAMENSLVRSTWGDTIDEGILKGNLDTYKNVEQKLRAAQTGDSAKTAGISVESLLDRKYVPQTVVGYDPKGMLDALAKNAPTVVGGRSEVLQGGGGSTGKNVPLAGGKSAVHVEGVPDSLIVNEGAKVSNDGLYRTTPDIGSDGKSHGKVVGYGYNLDQNKGNINSDFSKAGIPEYKRNAALAGEEFALSQPEVDKLAKVVYDREGVGKATKIIGNYNKLSPMMKEIAADMAYRGDLVPGEKGYRGDLVEVLKTNDVNQVYKYVNEMGVPQEVKTRLGNIMTVERPASYYEGSGTTRVDKSILTAPQHQLIKEGKINEVLSGMKRQADREDWSTGTSMVNKDDIDTGRTITMGSNPAVNKIIGDYVKSGGGMVKDYDLAVRLQREGKMSKQEAEATVKRLKQELNPTIKVERSFYD